jgi:hypothetical protein
MLTATKLNLKNLPRETQELLESCPGYLIPESGSELIELALGGKGNDYFEVAYEIPGEGRIVAATVARAKNGIVANYPDPYMRRRDPEAVVIGDERPTDKTSFKDRFGRDFGAVRQETLAWLKTQELIVAPFVAGERVLGVEAMAIAPVNAAFFVFGLSHLQGSLEPDELDGRFAPRAIIYVAPPFRHTHFGGQQLVVHNRRDEVHELFAYNLYPGPSAKKGVYGVLINIGEREGWVTAHCSTVQVVTPYDNIVTIMHEGASGGGKSEMLEQIHREPDGMLLLGANTVTGQKKFFQIPRTCELRPVTDDMAMCHPSLKGEEGKLTLVDAEDGWFVRCDHINSYGKDPTLERLTATPPEPLLFLNVDCVPGGRALIWDHILDAPGKPCPNPRVVVPRRIVPGVVNGPVSVDIRSMGIRTPPCTEAAPTYGIVGLFHILPPALAWLWRLVAPRGHANPSIVATEGMTSEGVGSYWPFATGRRVDQANLLLRQFLDTPKTRYILVPNQHIGAWETGFMPQWIMREYLARRGPARFQKDQIAPSRCPLLGYALNYIQVEGSTVPTWFLQVETQPEVGEEAYDRGAAILDEFFKRMLKEFLVDDLAGLGRRIIQCCLDGGRLKDFEDLIPDRSGIT